VPWDAVVNLGVAVFIAVVLVLFIIKSNKEQQRLIDKMIHHDQDDQSAMNLLIEQLIGALQGNKDDSYHELIKVVENQTITMNRAFEKIDSSFEKFTRSADLMYGSFNELIRQNKTLLDRLETFIEKEEMKKNGEKCNS